MTTIKLKDQQPGSEGARLYDLTTDKKLYSKGSGTTDHVINAWYVPNSVTISGSNDECITVYEELSSHGHHHEGEFSMGGITGYVDPSRIWDPNLARETLKQVNSEDEWIDGFDDMPRWLSDFLLPLINPSKEAPVAIKEVETQDYGLTLTGKAPTPDVECGSLRGHQWTPITNNIGVFSSNENVTLDLAWKCILCRLETPFK